jgi:hypothetical protein
MRRQEGATAPVENQSTQDSGGAQPAENRPSRESRMTGPARNAGLIYGSDGSIIGEKSMSDREFLAELLHEGEGP